LLKSKLPQWVRYYNWLLIGLLIVMLILWILKIQVFNNALLPLITTLAIRYWYLAQLENKN